MIAIFRQSQRQTKQRYIKFVKNMTSELRQFGLQPAFRNKNHSQYFTILSKKEHHQYFTTEIFMELTCLST